MAQVVGLDIATSAVRAAEVDTGALIEDFFKRVEIATAAMFASAPDAEFADLAIVNHTLLSSLSGTVRSLFDRNLPKPWACGVQQQLIFMGRSYLEAAKMPSQATDTVQPYYTVPNIEESPV